jgi:hypothetical protein
MRVRIMLVGLGLIVGSAAIWTAEPSVAAPKPVRSGTIVSGFYIPHQGVGPVPTCDTVPTCAAWQASGCNAALAGREPAVGASIVPVRDLANGRTPRRFAFSMGLPAAWSWGYVTLQFWRSDCTEALPVRSTWRSSSGRCELGVSGRDCGEAWFLISRTTAWVTVTPTGDNVNIDWSLT